MKLFTLHSVHMSIVWSNMHASYWVTQNGPKNSRKCFTHSIDLNEIIDSMQLSTIYNVQIKRKSFGQRVSVSVSIVRLWDIISLKWIFPWLSHKWVFGLYGQFVESYLLTSAHILVSNAKCSNETRKRASTHSREWCKQQEVMSIELVVRSNVCLCT